MTTALCGLREARHAAGLSQEALAHKVGCSTSTIRIIEGGYRPSMEMSERIAAALGVDVLTIT